MNEYQKQIDLINSKIATVSYANPPPYIHCSKINCFLRQIKELSSKVLTLKIENYKKMSNTMRNNFSNLMNALTHFQQLHSQCCGEVCAQFALTTSIRCVKAEIASIRKDCIKYLENLGIKTASTYLHLDDSELESQDRVDIKRIAVIINHLQMRPEIAKREEVAPHLKKRLNSLDSLGIPLQSDECRLETISFSDLPTSLSYIVKFEDIEFGPLIGEGEAGKVYRGSVKTRDKSNVECAIKILHCRSLTAYDLEMYRREIFTMSNLRHPSLLKFCGYTTEPPFCVLTEYMENGSLYDYLLQHPKDITPTDKTLIALDIARGLEFLHCRGIIHRDLKSLNILLDSRKRAKIADFGLTRMKSKDPMTGLVGTSHWMAPEVLMSSPYYDEKVDIYSFGILMWELLTSECPYQNESLDPATLTLQIMEQNKRPTIPPGTPPNLKALIESCWNKDPKSRPSCHEIISDLSNPSFQFPGSELVLMMQETRLLRSNNEQRSSSPLSRYMNHNLIRNDSAINFPIGFNMNEMDRIEASLKLVTDTLEIGHIEHFENAISQLKASLKISKIDFHKLVKKYLDIIITTNESSSKTSPVFMIKLVNVFFELLNDCKCNDQICIESCMKECSISDIIRSNNTDLVELMMTHILAQPFKIFFNDNSIETLFEFASNSNQKVRIKGLLLLLHSVDFRFDDIINEKIPNFIEKILNFTKRKIPNKVLKIFYKKLLKIFKEIQDIQKVSIRRIPDIMLATPKELRTNLSACIETLLIRFPVMRTWSILFTNAIEDYESYGALFQAVFMSDETQEPTAEMLKALATASEENDDAFSNLIDFTSRFDSSYELTVSNLLPINSKNEKLLASFYGQIITKSSTFTLNKKKRNASFHTNKESLDHISHNFQRSHSRTKSSIPIINFSEIVNNNGGLIEKPKKIEIVNFSSSPRLIDDDADNIEITRPHKSCHFASSFGSLINEIHTFNFESDSKSSSFNRNANYLGFPNDNLLKYAEFYKAASTLLDSPSYTRVVSSLLTSKNADPAKIQDSGICEVITRSVINETRESEFLNLMFNLSCKSFFKQFIVAVPKLFSNMRNSMDKEIVRLSFICLAVIAKNYTDEFDFYLLLRHAAKAVNTQTGFAQTASSFVFQKFVTKETDSSFIQEITEIFLDSYTTPSKPASIVAKVLVDFITLDNDHFIRDEFCRRLKQIANLS
ncbi:hypothetical protein M9Y10_008080 [Tritrichomonas musculus]|uniref:Protein kinase domain-containing protein n=1 Tax=Tritrichomonas musculus TaxID=1915356 RepID=A0ABR2IY91_9EUKA